MAQKERTHMTNDLLSGCDIGAVKTFGDGKLYGYIITPLCLIPIGKELGIHIQLKNWKPQTIFYQ